MPRWNTVSPPELAGDAPVMNVAHPLEICLGVVFRRERDLTFFYRLNRAIGQRLDLDEPLCGKPGFHNGLPAVTLANSPRVFLDAREQAKLFQIAQDFLSPLIAVQTFIRPAILVDARLVVHYIDLRQIVAQTNRKVIRIMRRRDLYRAATELRI